MKIHDQVLKARESFIAIIPFFLLPPANGRWAYYGLDTAVSPRILPQPAQDPGHCWNGPSSPHLEQRLPL